MTRDEALVILEVDDGRDPAIMRAEYASRSADLAQRVASAAAPTLRQKYEQQAIRLREARDLLLGNGPAAHASTDLSPDEEADLPRTTPIVTSPGASGALGGPEAAGDAMSITPGQVLAERYEIRAQLGSGGMGAVFAAFDRLRQEEIAVKVLLPHLLADPKSRDRFLNEAKIATSLSHPNIVWVYDIHQTERFTFLTMERLKGRNLREEISRRAEKVERFSITEVRSIAVSVCEALQFAHRFTVHRDVKPENIWLAEDGTVNLTDFGIARLMRPSQLSSTCLALGTAYYMAPEQLRGQEVDNHADQFALGVVLYELLTGEIPLGVVKQPHQLRGNIPLGMSRAVMRALEARPEARHADMAAFGRALAIQSRSAVGARAALTVAISVVLGVAVAFAFWRFWVHGVRNNNVPMDMIYDSSRAIVNSLGMKLELIPAGRFEMGSAPGEKDADSPEVRQYDSTGPRVVCGTEKPRHWVRITRPFYLNSTEVTRGQFRQFVNATGYKTEVEKEKIWWSDGIGANKVNLDPGYDVELTSPLDKLSNMPTEGRKLVVLAEVKGVLHVRAFDDGGKMAVDTNEHKLNGTDNVSKNDVIGLKKELESLWPPHKLCRMDRARLSIELTQLGCSPYQNTTWFNPGFEQTDDHPVVLVTWNDAVNFCDWLSRLEGERYRLPTEAEWEYACRAGTATNYFSGDDPETLAAFENVADAAGREKYPKWTATVARDGYVYTAPVAQFRINAFGLYDMHGNVKEWCQDWYEDEYYKRSPENDPVGSTRRISMASTRGGSWSSAPGSCRSAVRSASRRTGAHSQLGFRVVREQSGR